MNVVPRPCACTTDGKKLSHAAVTLRSAISSDMRCAFKSGRVSGAFDEHVESLALVDGGHVGRRVEGDVVDETQQQAEVGPRLRRRLLRRAQRLLGAHDVELGALQGERRDQAAVDLQSLAWRLLRLATPA